MWCKKSSLGLPVYKVHILKPYTSIIIYLVFPLNELYKIAVGQKHKSHAQTQTKLVNYKAKWWFWFCFQTWPPEYPGRLVETQTPWTRIFRFIQLGWLLRICISHKFSDMADDAAGLGTSPWRPLISSTLEWWPHTSPVSQNRTSSSRAPSLLTTAINITIFILFFYYGLSMDLLHLTIFVPS